MENLPLASSAGSSVGDDSIVVSWGTQEGLRNNLTVETLVIWGVDAATCCPSRWPVATLKAGFEVSDPPEDGQGGQ